jgi:hypothetical protein
MRATSAVAAFALFNLAFDVPYVPRALAGWRAQRAGRG